MSVSGSMLGRNLIANMLGQGCSALLAFVFIPVYVHYLGLEAYGLVGVFAVLQSCFGLLDFGIAPTLGREMARLGGGTRTPQSARDLLRSFEWIIVGLAILLAGLVALGATWLAERWLRVEAIPTTVVADVLMVMALVAGLRLVEGIYRSCILGLQRQVLFNWVQVALGVIRSVGAIGVLALVSPTIKSFMLWQVLVSVVSVAALAAVTYRTLPPAVRAPRFSLEVIREVRSFSAGIFAIAVVAVLLTQIDKLMLSTMLSLSEFGRYTLVATAASLLYMPGGPVTTAFYPRFCELHARGDEAGLAEAYHTSAQLISILVGSLAVIMALLSDSVLFLWTGDAGLSADLAPLLSVIVLGNCLNTFMWVPYHAQLAHGWTSLTLTLNLVALLGIVPAMAIFVPMAGVVGAAWIWVALNTLYVTLGVALMHRRILKREGWRWGFGDVLLPVLGATVAVGVLRFAWPSAGSRWESAIRLSTIAACAAVSAVAASSRIRRWIGVVMR